MGARRVPVAGSSRGGCLCAGSPEPVGSDARLVAPLQTSAVMPPAENVIPPGSGAAAPVNILIVDDRKENRIALRAILESPEYRILESASGDDALLKLLDHEFAVLLLDVVMPGMNGFELAMTIKARKRTATVPILFLSAEATDLELMSHGYRAGAVDYLIKPLVPEMVRAKVAVFAELYRQRLRIDQQAKRILAAEREANELRLAELRLASERRYRTLAEALPNMVWTADAEGKPSWFNERWFEYTGQSLADALEKWEDAMHPDDRPRARRDWAEAVRTLQPFEGESRLRRGRDSSYRWHLCRAIAERESNEHPLRWLGTFTDIDDQKRAHAALAEFKMMLDAVLDAVFIFEPDELRFMYANHGASVLSGFTREVLVSMRPIDLLPDADEVSFRQLLAELRRRSETILTLETRVRRRDGTMVPVEVSLQLIPMDNGRVVALARDITEHKASQAERERLYREAIAAIKARDDFLSAASHELRTPLSILTLQMEMMLRVPGREAHAVLSPEQSRAKLETAWRQVARLRRLVSELLDVSLISSGGLQIDREELDLTVLVHDVVDRFQEEAARAQSTIEVVAPGPVTGQWDRERVDQVLTNLLTNALKFGARKPIIVQIEDAGSLARVVVIDRGIGIAREDIERIFNRYEQAISSRSYGGLGLGLYIAQQIVKEHGGTIRVESSAGSGSRFTVELPRAAATTNGAAVRPGEPHAA
jgi:PAS domain S-box-containing protein